MKGRGTWTVVALVLVTAGCGGTTRVVATPDEGAVPLAELWVDPGERPRDLFWGIGGRQYAPDPDATYEFKSRDDTGFSASYDVVGPDGTEWSAKIGPEAQTEVVVSRVLWGLGYHQPPIYYLPSWKLQREGELRVEREARFRPKLPQLKRLREYWKWAENPFVDTRAYKNLLVALLILNSTDLKDDNNSLYELDEPWDGSARWFVVRDVGAALGETGKLFPRRNWLEGFENEPFIQSVDGDKIKLHYQGRHQELIDRLAPADVRAGAQMVRRVTDDQWRAAFRAGNYADASAQRFIRRIKQKIEDGVALRADSAARD